MSDLTKAPTVVTWAHRVAGGLLTGVPLMVLHVVSLRAALDDGALWRVLALYSFAGAAIGLASSTLFALAGPRDPAEPSLPSGQRAVLLAVVPAVTLVTADALIALAEWLDGSGARASLRALALVTATAPAAAAAALAARRLSRVLGPFIERHVSSGLATSVALVVGFVGAGAVAALAWLAMQLGPLAPWLAACFAPLGRLIPAVVDDNLWVLPVALGCVLLLGRLCANLGRVVTRVALVAGAALLFAFARDHDRRHVLAPALAGPPLAAWSLAALRLPFDRDGDGAATAFGARDCDDRDARRHPQAAEIAGDGIDQDCNGADLARAPRLPSGTSPAMREALRRRVPARLNVLLLTVDTLRADLGRNPTTWEPRPTLDRLAAASTVFTHAYSSSDYTAPSLGGMMIGRFAEEAPHRTQYFMRYDDSNVLLAERLRDAGYRTVAVSALDYVTSGGNLMQGIGDVRAVHGVGLATENDGLVADAVVAALGQGADDPRPFFLWAHFFDPHEPHPRSAAGPHPRSDLRRDYAAEVAGTDRALGRVLAALHARPEVEARTVVVLSADHGESLGEHGQVGHARDLTESVVRVPLLIYVPGLDPHVVQGPRSTLSMVPTLLDLLGLPQPAPDAPDSLSGHSLAGDLLEPDIVDRPVRICQPADGNGVRRVSLVLGSLKLDTRADGPTTLYNLATDPAEAEDLSTLPGSRVDELLAELRRIDSTVRSGAAHR